MEKKLIRIDAPKIKAIATKGINRAAIFMGLGINAALDERLKKYLLTSEINLQLLPSSVEDNILLGWKKEFAIWIVAAGFREMIERFCVFLDRIHHASLLILKKYTKGAVTQFEKYGLNKKIGKLNEDFNITCQYPAELCTIYNARNCLVHRMGHVSKDDLNEGNKLSIKWVSPIFYLRNTDATETQMPDLMDPSTLPLGPLPGGSMVIRFGVKQIDFVEGEWIKIKPRELQEILFFMTNCVNEYMTSFQKMAKDTGVFFEETNTIQPSSK